MTLKSCLSLLGLFLFPSLSCVDDIQLYRENCGISCYNGPRSTLNVGECKAGYTVCDNGSNAIDCTAIKPITEFCDGKDNDCDGRIDEELDDIGSCPRTECAAGRLVCVLAREICVCDSRPVTPEACESGQSIDVEFCYTGPPYTAFHPPCRPGVKVCLPDGTIGCTDQPPREEQCGSMEDLDCDGVIGNYQLGDINRIDIVFSLDLSGSNEAHIPDILEAVRRFTELHQSLYPTLRIAIVEFPAQSRQLWWDIISDFTDPQNAWTALSAVQYPDPGSFEPSQDVIMAIAEHRIPLLYDSNAKLIHIMFEDEHPQTLTGTAIDVSECRRAVADANQRFLVLTTKDYQNLWTPYLYDVPFTRAPLIGSSDEIFNVLRQVLQVECR